MQSIKDILEEKKKKMEIYKPRKGIWVKIKSLGKSLMVRLSLL